MKTTCLVNNYNYARYVVEAVESALAQTRRFDEIIVVDDGSTDASRELLLSRYAQHPLVQLIEKPNQGQLSCFNEGFRRSTGDLIFFLDADDLYEPPYVEDVLDIYRQAASVDCIFVSSRTFGRTVAERDEAESDRDHGYSVLLALMLEIWIGAPTSCLSMRRSLLEKILPLPLIDDWRTRADDCLVYGASLAGGRKYHRARPWVRYRVHDANHYFGTTESPADAYRRGLALNRLFQLMVTRMGYDRARLTELVDREFRTFERPTRERFAQYAKIVRRAPLRLSHKVRLFRCLARHLCRPERPAAPARHDGGSPTISKAA
ncbi:MAG: glycosyltransferase family 2 protein [Pirellulaceae bacterium]